MDVEVLVHAGPAEETVARLRSVGVAARGVSDLSAAAAAGDGDIVVVRAGARPCAGFLERLAGALHDTVATVSALALEGDPDMVATRSLRLRPRTTRLALDFTWVTRAALDAAGPLDGGFGKRCSDLGLVHVVADDVLVGGVPATEPGDPLDDFEYGDLPPRPPTRLTRAVTWTRRVVDGLDVTLDGRMLRTLQSGTEVQALALIEALQRTGAVRLRVLLEEGITPPPGFPDVETISAATGAPRTAIVHRIQQIASPEDLVRLAHVGERLVVSHLDLLLFHDPAYHATPDRWAGYRRMTSAALAAADLVVAISDHVADDLLAEDLVAPARLRSVHLGTDHERAGEAVMPAGVEALRGRPFLVQLGSDLRHKNRPFSIELVRELRGLGWPGTLVLAGPGVEYGSSRVAEDELLAGGLAEHVVRLGAVTDAERRWLYREAAAVAFPSTNEGFGLVPFEAAAAGTAPLVAPVSAMAELLGPALALLVPWDAAASARRVLPVLGEPDPLVEAVREIGTRLTWDRTAQRLLGLYDETLALPARAAAVNALQVLAAEARRGHWEGTYYALRNEVGANGLALVGEEGVLPEFAQRALLALLSKDARRAALGKLVRRAR